MLIQTIETYFGLTYFPTSLCHQFSKPPFVFVVDFQLHLLELQKNLKKTEKIEKKKMQKKIKVFHFY